MLWRCDWHIIMQGIGNEIGTRRRRVRITLIFLLQYLLGFVGSAISILTSAAPDSRLRFDVIFWANDRRRLVFGSRLHSFKIVLDSWSSILCAVSSSFSAAPRETQTERKANNYNMALWKLKTNKRDARGPLTTIRIRSGGARVSSGNKRRRRSICLFDQTSIDCSGD